MDVKFTSQVGQDRLQLHEVIPLETPLVIYVEPSGFCNLKCGFCPHGTAPERLKKDMMSIELFKKMIDDISLFPRKVKLLRICGNGDPLLNRQLPAMIEYASARKASEKIELITNGILLTPELINTLPRYLTRLVCSVEGLSAADYRRICNTTIDYDRFLKSLDALYAARGECIIHIKIHHEAVPSAEQEKTFFETFRDKCDEIFIEKLVPMWPQLETQYSSNQFRWGDESVTKRRVCAQIFKGVQVQADGEVVPCCVDWQRANLLGDLHEESLSRIWNGERLRRLQIDHLSGNKSLLEPCRDCSMNDYCEIDNLDDYGETCINRFAEKEQMI